MDNTHVLWLVFCANLSIAVAAIIPEGETPIGVGLDTPQISLTETDLDLVGDYLAALLREDPWSRHESPLLYVERVPPDQPDGGPNLQDGTDDDDDGNDGDDDNDVSVQKRARYYRRYPWKRVSRTRTTYDPDMYMCNPSRQDVLQLLVGLHRAREGDTGRTINFCNRKRPAASVFTNIRFIGRRK